MIRDSQMIRYNYAPKQPKYRVTGYIVVVDYNKPAVVVDTQEEAQRMLDSGKALQYTEQRTPTI